MTGTNQTSPDVDDDDEFDLEECERSHMNMLISEERMLCIFSWILTGLSLWAFWPFLGIRTLIGIFLFSWAQNIYRNYQENCPHE